MSRIVGPVAPGANPVIGPTGKVYIGNLRGELHAFYAEGLEYWTRQLDSEHGGIFASPLVLPDGTIFVVSAIHHMDSHDNESFLHRFSPDGTRLFSVPFPKSPYLPFTDGGATTAPPNLWRWNGDEAIMVPVVYQGLGRDGVSVIAFGRNGDVQGNHLVGTNVYEITTIPSEGFSECVNRNSCEGRMTALGTPTVRQSPGGETIASAAASCTHVFVSTTDGLFTFRADTMGQVARANVPGGGLSAPVIGPTGAVYVVGQDTLYTFPGRPTGGVVVRTACDILAPPY